MSTKVRLTDAEIYPVHRADGANAQLQNWPFYRGREIIIGNPAEPDDGWTCGTDVVWPVLAVEGGLSNAGVKQPDSCAWVCRHQIQAGD